MLKELEQIKLDINNKQVITDEEIELDEDY